MTNGIDWLELLVQVIVAALGVALVSSLDGSAAHRRDGHQAPFRPVPVTLQRFAIPAVPLQPGSPPSAVDDLSATVASIRALQQRIELLVALGHAALHAGRQQRVTRVGVRADGPTAQPAAAVAEVLEPHELDVHHVRRTLEFEGLDDELVLPHGVERRR